MRKYFFAQVFILLSLSSFGQSIQFAKWTNTELVLNNGIVQRILKLPYAEGSFLTTTYKPVSGDYNYFLKTNTDFQFEVNDVVYSGKGIWKYFDIKTITDGMEGSGASVTLISQDKKVELTIKYMLYPNSPAVRKSLIVKNITSDLMKLESVDIEKFEVPDYYPVTFSWIYRDYGRRRYIGNYNGGKQDALIIVHDMNTEQGIVLGNEATGVLKHTSVFWEAADICVGLTHKDAPFPFRKWIAKGESFETPQVFTMVYNNQKTTDEILNIAVPDFVRKHMGIRLSQLKEKPTFVYNTWEPFKKEINEKLVMELAKAAADAGMKEFIIDDGWQDSYGDWGIDYKKFPNGLKPVFDYIKSLGMKPGIWVSIGSAAPSSKVYKAHPEWFVKDIEGKHASLHSPGDKEKFTACFGTGWYGYIKDILLKMAVEYGLEYYKLDFAVVTSAYTYDHNQSGCYSTDHSGHKDHNESLFTNYEGMWQLFDELHAAKPNLFIDCTFETLGGTQAIDYALLKHAEGDWLSNFAGAAGEKTDIRIRNMAWWRSPAMPATALVIGNPQMQDKGWETHIKSIAGALPIMLGDPRKLSVGDLKKYRGYADWLQLMESRYGIMSFRQDLPGFGEPMEGMWDGFQRINTDTKEGGIIGVFRHGSVENIRTVTVNWLDPIKIYQVKSTSGKVVATLTGKELIDKGFSVTLDDFYSGELYEICINETSGNRTSALNVPLKLIGSLKPRTTNEIESSNWILGCETLDRDFADYDQYKDYLVPLGIKVLRMQAGWAKTEKTKGVYDFTWLDRIIDDATGKGLKPWLQTSYGNTIYAGGGGANLGDGIPASKEALEAWDKWVVALVTRYKNKVKDWEVWNEPNFGDNTINSPQKVAELNIRTAEIIRRIQPDARISGLSMGHISISYAEDFFKYISDKGKMGLFDNMTYHDYAYNPDANYSHVEEFRSVLWKYAPGMKIRQGENGAPSAGGSGRGALWDYNWSELTQAKWDTRRMLGNLGHDIECSVFGIVEMAYNSGPINRMNFKGILKSDSLRKVIRPKIAYYAIQNVASVFDNSLERIKNLSFTYNLGGAGPDENKYSQSTDRSLAVYGYSHKITKKQIYTIWMDENIPTESISMKLQTFSFSNGNFDAPVFVDIVSGKVYEIPSSGWSKKGETYTFKNIPVYDSPILIADKSLIQLAHSQKVDLSAKWDSVRPLANPDKGWYHHMLDNGIGKYLLTDESELKSFPGMDHLYLRLAWAYLEPEEGKFNWSYIDDIVNKYVPLGYGISFRISCKETGGKPNSVPEEVDGVYYATPSWVKKAGAKGIIPTQYGSKSWTPDWDDPVFLDKLDNFHRAFAAKYDGKPWVRYIDVGSIGEWGEGHTNNSTRIPPSVEEIKANMDIYLKNYKKTQLVVTDDLLYWNKSEKDVKSLYDYAIAKGFTLRDDSPMVKYYVEKMIKTWSVSHPHFYTPLYLQKPIIFESEHYPTVKRNGLWLGKNGKDTIPSVGFSGAKIFSEAIRLEHATYIGFHGYAGEYLTDNPELCGEMLNLCGYWYFPKTVTLKETTNLSLSFEIEWLNKGVAPAYFAYQLKGKLANIKNPDKYVYFNIESSGNKNWLPDTPFTETYSTKCNEKLKGIYSFSIQLFDPRSGRPVEIGLNVEHRDSEGYYLISDIEF